jgi:orotidine-5'-phosphate decarboxylase
MIERRIIVALDVSDAASLEQVVFAIPPEVCRLKIGKELFTALGPRSVEICHRAGHEVFLDLKFHDIPNTCAMAVRAAARLGVWMINVHCSGGGDMLQAASDVLMGESHRPLLVGVTVLTSMDSERLREVGVLRSVEDQVCAFAALASDAGLDGLVCSAKEAFDLRALYDADFCLVTPGIRPAWAAANDQLRVATPHEAIVAGSDYLVIGRPITQAKDPRAALDRIIRELG